MDNNGFDLDDISIDPEELPKQPDDLDYQEERLLEEEYKNPSVLDKYRIRELAGFIEIRKEYTKKTYWFFALWCISVFIILILGGFSLCGFFLPASVLSVLVGSTTVSVIGLVAIIGRGVFNRTDI
jgi:hypothetical protein